MAITPNDPANFTPTRGSYKELTPFRFWCQKVLPLVYDDSLSYYELLNKVVNYLNVTMEDVETLEGDVSALHEAYVQLESYVNDYFTNLDVQEEINNKLDDMAESGVLFELINPYLPDMISDWLSEHITPTTPVIDDTLSIPGAGADSKTVGDRALLSFSNASENSDLDEYTKTGIWRILSNTVLNWPFSSFGTLMVLNATNQNNIHGYTIQLAFSNDRKIAYRVFMPNGLTDWYLLTETDNTLTHSGIPADAKTVGDITNNHSSLIKKISVSGNYKWGLGYNVNASGAVTVNPTVSLSEKIPIRTNESRAQTSIVERDYPAFDDNNIALFFYVNEYSDNQWIRRTSLDNKGDTVELSPITNYIRIGYGRASASNVPASLSDILTYFSCNIYTKTGSEGENIVLNDYIDIIKPDNNFIWILGYSINSSGTIYANNYGAITSKFKVNKGDKITSYIPPTDGTNVLNLNIHSYNGDTWLRRTALYNGDSYTIPDDTNMIRFVFSRNSGTVEMSNSDINTYFNVKTINKSQKVNENTKIEVSYISTGESDSTEQINIDIPRENGEYIRYNMGHCVNATKNSDVWRLMYLYKIPFNKTSSTVLTRRGEFELAIMIRNRPDYSGGVVHGNEVDQKITFIADNAEVLKNNCSGLYDEFKIIRNSILYDANDNTTPICEHGCEYIFTKNGLKINQSVKWLVAEDIQYCMMGMLPILKTYSTYRYDNTDFKVVENNQTSYTINISKATKVTQYGNNLVSTVECPVLPTGYSGGDRMRVTDNGGNDYNKIYFIVCAGWNSVVNELFKAETIYKYN